MSLIMKDYNSLSFYSKKCQWAMPWLEGWEAVGGSKLISHLNLRTLRIIEVCFVFTYYETESQRG